MANSKLDKMMEVIKDLKIGQPVKYKGLDAEVLAFSDEHVFLKIPEVSCTPEEFEGTAGDKRVRDRHLANLQGEVWALERKMQQMLEDPRYYDHMRRRFLEEHHRPRRADPYWPPSVAPNLKPHSPGSLIGDDVLSPQSYIDPLMFKAPSQQRRN